MLFVRVHSVQERLRVDKENANFEIAAFFQSPVRWWKKRGNFKTFIVFDYPESFLYCLCSKLYSKYLYFDHKRPKCTKMYEKQTAAFQLRKRITAVFTRLIFIMLFKNTILSLFSQIHLQMITKVFLFLENIHSIRFNVCCNSFPWRIIKNDN